MLDLYVIKKRAADRLAAQGFDARPVANSANRLIGEIATARRISQLATLASNESPPADPDRWCWPQSEAMNTAEIDRFRCRVVSFIRRGITDSQAELVADRLVIRDREQDDRRTCLECNTYRPGRCGNPRAAGLNGHAVGADLATLLQRCPGFAPLTETRHSAGNPAP